MQLFLARTSILSQLNGALCDAVVGDSLPTIDSLSTLRMLEQAGIFVTRSTQRGSGSSITACSARCCSTNYTGPMIRQKSTC